ncbi:MAG TPA: alkaline phosphatase family protein [Anaerolineae bacterium]
MLKIWRAIALISLLAGCMGPVSAPSIFTSPSPVSTPTPAIPVHNGVPEFKHVFVILLENRESNEVTGAQSMPYFNSLVQQGATSGQYYGIMHPSLPNYLALTSGSTAGITSDCTDCFVASSNLASQLKAAGRTWKAYMESMPSPCYIGNDGQYVQRHDPFIYYDDVRKDPGQCKNVVPFTQFAADLRANNLPDFNWISPNLCNDMHDCDEAAGDAWLKAWIPQILASPAWQDRGALFILFDEGSSNAGCCDQKAAGGKVAMLAVSPLSKPGYVSTTPSNHYSLLRTIEEAWQMPLLGNAGSPATPNLADLFTTSGPDIATTLARVIAALQASGPPATTATPEPAADMQGMPGMQATPGTTATATTSYEFDWKEGSNFTIAEWWNASSEAGCAYAANSWPRQALALHRAFVLAARQVLRNEWDINSWIAKNRPSTSEARIHGAETGCYSGHIDYPAHIHVFYLARDAKGTWLHLNSHNYMDAQGRFYDDFVIPDICGQKSSYHIAVNEWLSILDEKCTTVWQQRYTSAGDMELRRSESAPVYALRARSASGDLASADVLLAGKVIATAQIVRYDPLAMTMNAVVKDYQKKEQTFESWQGDPQAEKNLTTHTAQTIKMTDTAPAPITPGVLAGANGGQPVRASATVTLSVVAGNDNAFQDGTNLTTDDKAIYVGDNRDPNNSYAGLRFQAVPVISGASVQKAILQFHVSSDQKTQIKLGIYGAAAGETQQFGPDNLPGQLPGTTAKVPYTDTNGWAGGTWVSIDVTSIVSEITLRPDWVAGNALSIIIKGASGQQGYRRLIDSYASWDHNNVPRLTISY